MQSTVLRNATIGLGALALVVRVWALFVRSPDLGAGWPPLAAAAMGFVYLAVGVLVVRSLDGASASLLGLHCFAQAIHWGGPPGLDGTPRLIVWLLYYVISVLGEAALVDYVVTFPARARRMARPLTAIIYSPAGLLLAATFAVVLMPEDLPLRANLLSAFFTLEMVAANGLAAIALLLLVVRVRRHAPDVALGRALRMMVRVAAIGYLPYVAASALESLSPGSVPVGTQPFTLFFVIVPVGFAAALLRYRPR